jgi:hypothetical protein
MIGSDPGPGSPRRPYFKVALNLPHAGRVARRIFRLLSDGTVARGPDSESALRITVALVGLLDPCMDADENPPAPGAEAVRDRAAALGRDLVEHIERGGFGHDRLGQCVRNFFECLELGPEGAEISLRAGENPRSLQRPF